MMTMGIFVASPAGAMLWAHKTVLPQPDHSKLDASAHMLLPPGQQRVPTAVGEIRMQDCVDTSCLTTRHLLAGPL